MTESGREFDVPDTISCNNGIMARPFALLGLVRTDRLMHHRALLHLLKERADRLSAQALTRAYTSPYHYPSPPTGYGARDISLSSNLPQERPFVG